MSQLPPLTDECDRRPFNARCTSQKPTLDEAVFPNVLICAFELRSKVKGHVNWAVASTVGELLWLNFAADGDYNFMFFPDDGRGLTKNNGSSKGIAEPVRQFIELEFDSRETAAHFGTTWWQNFDKVVHEHRRGEAVQRELNPAAPGVAARGVVYGLFGLDCEHDCHSEFHPVYAVAIEVGSSAAENRWAIFVRNWGNEGFCSKFDHHLQLADQKFRLVLPRRGERPSVIPKLTQFASSDALVPFPDVAFDPISASEGQIVLTFTLPAAERRADADMLLTLEWPRSAPAPATMRFSAQPPGAAPAPATPAGQRPPGTPEEPEEYLERVLTEVQAQPSGASARAAGAALTPPKANRIQPTPDPVPILAFERPVHGRVAPRGRLSRSEDKERQDKAFIDDLCRRLASANRTLPTFNGRDVTAMCRMP